MKKRIVSIILTLCIAFMLMPTVVLALEVTVTTEAELKAAVQSGGTINLGADIALTEPLIVNDPLQGRYRLTLNMNGYTLTGTIKLTACMFTLNGRLDADVEAKAYVDPSNFWPSNLYGGTYAGEVHLDNSCIFSGTFKNKVSGSGDIIDGTFYEDVTCENIQRGSFLGSCTVTGWIFGGIFYGAYSPDKVTADQTLIYNSDDEVHAIEFCSDRFSFLGAEAPNKKGYSFQGWYEKNINGEFWETPMEFPFSTENLPFHSVINVYAQWKEDIQKPVIAGLENGKTYCDAVEFTVSDNDGIASVTANNVELTATDGKYTLSKGVGTVTVVAKDNAGNETSATVTVNNGHTAGNDDGNCSTPVYCIYHPDTVVVAAKSHDFSGEWQKNGTDHWHICQNDGCTVAETETPHSCTDDGDCTTAVICECGYVITAANAKHTYGEWQSNSDDTHTRYCTVEGCNGYEDGNCAGGEATCTSKAVCDTCGEEYGELDSSNHTGSKEWETTETQHKQYWSCCDAVVVDYEDHTWNNGVCSVCGYPCSHDYDSVVTPPTCTESGYTTHTCANCGNSYVDSEVPATGHSFKFFKCVNCGMHYGCKGANCVFCSIVRWLDGLINSCEIWLTEAPVSIGKWFAGIFNCIVSAIK